LLTAVLTPVKVQGQFEPVLCDFVGRSRTINSTLESVIGGGLSAINGVLTTIQQFEQQVVWPAQAIAQARGLVGGNPGHLQPDQEHFHIPISSATLANPRQLEAILLSRVPTRSRDLR